MKNLLILTEAGEGIGMGHYTRCSAILEAAKELGIETKMLLYEAGNTFSQIQPHNTLDWAKNIDVVISKWVNTNTHILVDSYLAPSETLETLNKKAHLTVLDDYNRIKYPANLLVNPNVYFNPRNYKNQSCRCVGGRNYVILRKPFRDAAMSSNKNTTVHSSVLITLGGDDFRNLLPRLCQLAVESDLEGHTVCPNQSLALELKSQFPDLRVSHRLTAEEMCELMQSSGLVISACGQTLHELVALHKTTIGICLDHDQVMNSSYYNKTPFINVFDWNDPDLIEKIKVRLHKTKPYPDDSIFPFNFRGVYNIVDEIFKAYEY